MSFHSSVTRLFRAIFTSASALAILVSCSDSTSPRLGPELDASNAIEVLVPEAEKLAYLAEMTREYEARLSGNFIAPSMTMSTGFDASPSVVAGPRPYTKARVPFAPEPAPANVVPGLTDDGLFPAIPLGFDFEFYGNVYSSANLYMNGFIMLGSEIPLGPTGKPLGFYAAGSIPDVTSPNNIIALAWNDWQPHLVPGSIRYETRGTAPNRRFVLQFTNVPEYRGTGRLNSQLVLHEGSNQVTISSSSVTITSFGSRITQGVENASATQATFDSVQVGQLQSPRVRGWFNLTSDAVMFSPPAPNKAPVVLAPANLSVNTAPGSCSAAVEVGSASFSDDAPGASLVGGVRSDNEPLDALYPKGITTIAWTSVDAEEAKTTVNQLVTVSDAEKPSITAPEGISADNDPGKGSAAVATGTPVAEDNCTQVSVAGARSDGALMSAPFPVGLTTITWTASDESGNKASATQSVLVRDVEAPSISGADISLDATSRSGAVVSFTTVSSDNVGVVQVSCSRQSGSMFPIGATTVTCTAVDAAGNSASARFVVTVHGAAEQLIALIGFIDGLDLSNGTANPILNQLSHALNDVEDENGASCKKIDDFIRMLTERKKSLEISSVEVSGMLADARRIQAVLGCQ